MSRSVNFDDSDKLIEKTVSYMLKNNLSNLEGGYRKKDNHFRKITSEYFKNDYQTNAVFNLYIKWIRNDKNFRTKVLEKLSMETLKDANKKDFLSILIDCLTWERLKECVSKIERSKFLYASNEIFEKLFCQNNLKCKIKLQSNSFTTSKQQKPGRKYWKGNFICKKCDFVFKSYIMKKPTNNEPVELILISFVNDCLNEQKIIKKRLQGEERRKIQHEVVSKGVLNFQSEAHFIGIFFSI